MMDRIWRFFGGRKQANGYLASLLLTVMAGPLEASFAAYAGAILLALGITSGLVTLEDIKRKGAAHA